VSLILCYQGFRGRYLATTPHDNARLVLPNGGSGQGRHEAQHSLVQARTSFPRLLGNDTVRDAALTMWDRLLDAACASRPHQREAQKSPQSTSRGPETQVRDILAGGAVIAGGPKMVLQNVVRTSTVELFLCRVLMFWHF
jgi:hypothetical protein